MVMFAFLVVDDADVAVNILGDVVVGVVVGVLFGWLIG